MATFIPKERVDELIVKAMAKECDRCTASVFDHEEEAVEFVQYFCDHWDSDDPLTLMTDCLYDDIPDMCPYCDHMMNKDD